MTTKHAIIAVSKFNPLNYHEVVRNSFTDVMHRAVPYKYLCAYPSEMYIDGFPFDYVFDSKEAFDAFIVSVPATITRRQCKKQLNNMDLLETVSTAVYAYASSLSDKKLANNIIIDWEDASGFDRSNETVLLFAQSLAWTDEQLDDFYVAASKI